MKKLLHERLRDYGENKTSVASVEADEDLLLMYQVFAKWSDEIERDYIPLPCDPDGETWKIGDEFEAQNVHHRCEGYLLFEGEWYLRSQHSQEFKASECKRPSPKVLDADGVEIKVGDTVWDRFNGLKYTITDLCADCAYVKVEDSIGYCGDVMPERLTHKEPDSVMRVADEMLGFNALRSAYDDIDQKIEEWADRLAAIMERDA